MRSATLIANQAHEFIETGELMVAGNPIDLTSERLALWRLVLSKTIPDLSATEITHKSGLESMDQGKLVGRLAELVKTRPELAERLQEAIGGRIIEQVPEAIEVPEYADTLTNEQENTQAL